MAALKTSTSAFVLGGVAIVAGVALLNPAVALIVAGAGVLAVTVLAELGDSA